MKQDKSYSLPNGNWVIRISDVYALGIPSEKIVLFGTKEELEEFGIDFNTLTEDKDSQFKEHIFGFSHIMADEGTFRKVHLKFNDYTYSEIQYYGFDSPLDEYEL